MIVKCRSDMCASFPVLKQYSVYQMNLPLGLYCRGEETEDVSIKYFLNL